VSDPEAVARSKSVWNKYVKSTLDDPDMAREVGEAIASAFLKNLHLFNLYYQLTEYLHSVERRKVLIANPLDVLNFKKGTQLLKFTMLYTDLTYTELVPMNITLKVLAASEGQLPAYRLLEWT